MFRAVSVILVLMTVGTVQPAMAAGKIASDPNAPGARIEKTVQDKDGRLDQKVTYDAAHKTVSEVLADLSQMTGVDLRPGYNSQDWQVRDRRMNISVKDTALSNLMESISRVMKLKWSRSQSKDSYLYRLYMERKAIADAERERSQEQDRLRRVRSEKQDRLLEQCSELEGKSEQEIEALKSSDVALYAYSKSHIAGLISAVSRDWPNGREMLTQGRNLSFSGSRLSPAIRNEMIGYLRSFKNLQHDPGNAEIEKGVKLLDVMIENIDQVTLGINWERDDNQRIPDFLMDLQLEFRSPDKSVGGMRMGIEVFDPNSQAGKLAGKLIVGKSEGRNWEDLNKEVDAGSDSAIRDSMKDFGEPPTEHSDDPELAVEIGLNPGEYSLYGIQTGVAKASSFGIVSDYFGRSTIPCKYGKGKVKLADTLDALAETYRYNWEKQGNIIEFRDRDWYNKRSMQIPEAWIEEWRKEARSTGTLDLDELARLSLLTSEQYTANLEGDELLGRMGIERLMRMYKLLLQAYSHLNDSQRASMFSPTGLNAQQISPDQWTAFAALLREHPAFLEDSITDIVFQGKKTKKDRRYVYEFTATASGGLAPVNWKLTTPEKEAELRGDVQKSKAGQ